MDTIPHMQQLFQCPVGLSDHTLGIGVAAASVALGAVVIEKHFTLSRAEGGVDSAFSLEPAELKLLAEECRKAWQAVGQVSYGPKGTEKSSLAFRRSLYAAQDIKKARRSPRKTFELSVPDSACRRSIMTWCWAARPAQTLNGEPPLHGTPLQEDERQMILREATEADALLLYQWRNDPSVREQSFNGTPIEWQDHAAWFRQALGNKQLAIRIAVEEDNPVGMLRLERKDTDIVVISVIVSPLCRGRGYGTGLIKQAAAVCRECFGSMRMQAWIKPGNIASQRAFANAGFKVESWIMEADS